MVHKHYSTCNYKLSFLIFSDFSKKQSFKVEFMSACIQERKASDRTGAFSLPNHPSVCAIQSLYLINICFSSPRSMKQRRNPVTEREWL